MAVYTYNRDIQQTLLYSTMGGSSCSNKNEQEAEACASQVSKDLLAQVGEYALKESRAGRCIPHVQAMDMIKQRMGWK